MCIYYTVEHQFSPNRHARDINRHGPVSNWHDIRAEANKRKLHFILSSAFKSTRKCRWVKKIVAQCNITQQYRAYILYSEQQQQQNYIAWCY